MSGVVGVGCKPSSCEFLRPNFVNISPCGEHGDLHIIGEEDLGLVFSEPLSGDGISLCLLLRGDVITLDVLDPEIDDEDIEDEEEEDEEEEEFSSCCCFCISDRKSVV